MSGCARFPIDVDGDLTTTPGSCSEIPVVIHGLPFITLEIAIKIIRTNGTAMTCNLIRNFVIPYINGTWQQAGIRFRLRSCMDVVPNATNGDANSTQRDERCFNRRFFTDRDAFMNVFVQAGPSRVYPDSYGYAMRSYTGRGRLSGQSYIMMNERYLHEGRITEMNLGLWASTLAHELGHTLDLEHNNLPGYLMYADAEGNEPTPGEDRYLTDQEVTVARARANRGVIPWDFRGVTSFQF